MSVETPVAETPSRKSSQPDLAKSIFGNVELGDQRRTKRLVRTFGQLQRHPGGTLPEKFSSPADLRGFYRLCDTDGVTHSVVIEAMRAWTLARIAEHDGDVLVVQDDTELDYSSLTSLAGDLGQIGRGHGRGYICHNVLAISATTGETIGLLNQILHRRVKTPKKETLSQRRERSTRESLLWLKGTSILPGDEKLVTVCDRGADTFEHLEDEFKSGRRFVVRSCKVRKVYTGHEPVGERVYLKQCVAGLDELCRFTRDIQKQRGRKARTDAEFIVRGGSILVCPPHAKHGKHGDEPLPLYAVQAEEVDPPAGEKPVTWTLLTNEPVQTENDAWRILEWYEKRWVVEEFHKAKKTGCRIEDMQFTTTGRLEPAIALLSMVAITLLNLRDASRRTDAKTRLANTLLADDYVTVLSQWRYKSKSRSKPPMTVHEFFMALARLGGHQNRKSDHPPGWLILWRGWEKLEQRLNGFDAAHANICGKT